MAHDLDSVRAALVNIRSRLLPQTDIVATGVGYMFTRGRKTDELSIVCSVTRKVALSQLAPRDQVLSTIDGIPTDMVATGVIRALQARTARRDRGRIDFPIVPIVHIQRNRKETP